MPPDLKKEARQTLLYIGHRLRAEARKKAPKQTTDLSRSIVVQAVAPLAVEVAPTVYYAPYVHEGTGLYGPKKQKFVIRPKRKKALSFKVKGQNIVTAKVVHPGQKPQPFLDEAWDKIEDWAAETIADRLGDETLKKLEFAAGKEW